MKKIILTFMAALLVSAAFAQNSANPKAENTETQAQTQESEDFARIDRVLKKMSARAQKEIKIHRQKSFSCRFEQRS
ncbi:hypothetical protein [Treponema zioleckii]|uniref:hypothetical protein n=1 Tax=Treponema zioleckii TaxID=331680 RepID=UPI00168BC7E4|nr:hypothetical protein [Treponema zioleckii]